MPSDTGLDEVRLDPRDADERLGGRILFIDHTAALGGGEVALLNLVRSMNGRRYVPVVLLLQEGPLREKLVAAGIETHVLPAAAGVLGARKDTLGFRSLLRVTDVRHVLASILSVARMIRRLDVKIVHTNSLKADIIGGIAARLNGLPVVWHIRDRIEDDYLPRTVVRVFRVLTKVIPNWVIANSGATFETLRRTPQGSATIHSGVDLGALVRSVDMDPRDLRLPGSKAGIRIVHDGTHAFLETRAEAPRLAGTSNPSPAYPLIGLVGRITRWKGQHVFLQAAAWTLRRFPEARFQIVGSALFGESEYEAEIRSLATRLGLDGAVQFLGFKSNIPEVMRSLDILVHASITGEPFGQVVIEGMAAGKPVVATDGGGIPEIVIHHMTGLLVPMGDAAAMAEAICYLLENPSKAAEMGMQGRERVLERFTVSHTAAKVQDVYDEILRAGVGAVPLGMGR